MEAVYLFSSMIVFGLIMIAILSYRERKYKKEHPEELSNKKKEKAAIAFSFFFYTNR
mgnify:CR=1 FL=1